MNTPINLQPHKEKHEQQDQDQFGWEFVLRMCYNRGLIILVMSTDLKGKTTIDKKKK